MRRIAVARASEIPVGERLIVDIDGRSIGIFHEGDRFYGLLNRCPHAGAELCRGDIVSLLESDRPGEYRYDAGRRLIACPWHGWEFDLETGQSYVDPRRIRVRPYEVSVEAGSAVAEGGYVRGPYVAETIPIEIDDDYLVLTVGSAPAGPKIAADPKREDDR